MSPLLKNDVAVPLDPLDIDMLDENDTDGSESVSSAKVGLLISLVNGLFQQDVNNWLAAQPKLTAKSKSGYILFSAEIRKRIMHENPEAGFGEVSKIVGIEVSFTAELLNLSIAVEEVVRGAEETVRS